jgi:hypothetical protein
MDVFIRNVPIFIGDSELEKFIEPILKSLSINTFACRKVGSTYANLTFVNLREGQNFLAMHGQGKMPLRISGTPIYCSTSTKPPDKFQLRSLEMEAKKKKQNKISRVEDQRNQKVNETTVHKFNSSSVSCGVWEYVGSELRFSCQITWKSPGEVKFARKSLIIILQSGYRIDISYTSIQALTIGGHSRQSFTLSLHHTPTFSNIDLETLLKQKLMIAASKYRKKTPRIRIPCLGSEHKTIAQSCLVYRIELTSILERQGRGLRFSPDIPTAIYQRTRSQQPQNPFTTEFRRMNDAFTSSSFSDGEKFITRGFPTLFQMQKLAQNGYLPPASVIELLPEAILMSERSGVDIAAEVIRKLFHQINFRGPETEAHNFDTQSLIELLRYNEERVKIEGRRTTPSARTAQSSNQANIYRAKVTPSGVYLYGPTAETMNRVLRQYSNNLEYFLRVQFCDEDGQPVRYNPQVSNDEIFYGRFKKVLQDGINIAGRTFGFLGYSHSSLRAQTCWFMAPFFDESDGELKFYQKLIGELGDFSAIHSPAKCAARIGQAFSDTPMTAPLGQATIKDMQDVERNGRVFSDGVGTFSESVLEQIWDSMPSKRPVKPTVFQIRHAGMTAHPSIDQP